MPNPVKHALILPLKSALFLLALFVMLATVAHADDPASGLVHAPLPQPDNPTQQQQPRHNNGWNNDLVVITQTPVAMPFPPGGFSTSPGADEALMDSPPAVSVTFARPVLPEQSTIKVYSGKGAQVNDGTVDANASGMSAAMPFLPAGHCKVVWFATFAGGAPSTLSGNFNFSISRHHGTK